MKLKDNFLACATAAALAIGSGTAMAAGEQAGAEGQQLPSPVTESMVRSLQQALQDQGYDVSTDGIWGPNTHQALQQFQQEQGLEAEGRIDMNTLAALNVEQTLASGQQQQQQAQAPQAGEAQQ